MRRLVLVLAMAFALVAMVLATDSSGAFVDRTGHDATITVDDTHNTTVVQPAADFIPRPSDSDDASSAVEKSPSEGNGGGLSQLAVAMIVSVSVAGLLLGLTLVVFAWRASRREEEAMFVDLGDDRNYVYGQFGDYAAM